MKRLESWNRARRDSSKRPRLTATNVISASTVRASTQKRTEVKRRPDAVIITPIPNVWRTDALPLISQGDGSINRDGRAVKLLGFEHRIAHVGEANGSVRFVYVLWKESLTPPGPSDIFDIIPGVPQIVATYNVDKAACYTILSDYVHHYENTSPALSGNESLVVNHYNHIKKLNFIQTYYGNLITDIADKAVYCFSVDSRGAFSTLTQASVSFIDI